MSVAFLYNCGVANHQDPYGCEPFSSPNAGARNLSICIAKFTGMDGCWTVYSGHLAAAVWSKRLIDKKHGQRVAKSENCQKEPCDTNEPSPWKADTQFSNDDCKNMGMLVVEAGEKQTDSPPGSE